MTEWAIVGETDGVCDSYMLSGYYECGDGFGQSLVATWRNSGFSHAGLCDWHDTRISLHYHDGCTYYGDCAGVFNTFVQEW